MIYIAFVLSIFFIVMICVIVKAYLKDIEELEERLLQLEKRINECEKHKCNCGGDETMACKKGKGGKRK